jgi:AcrR family transcriptional regulator/DNA-binding MarR family transcriptional regulator
VGTRSQGAAFVAGESGAGDAAAAGEPGGGRRPRAARVAAESRRGDVIDLQRARIVAAMVEVVAEGSVAQATIARVVERSGVSRRTFYELFEDREDCFLAALDLAVSRARARVAPAFAQGGGWLEQIRTGLRALLEFVDDEPGLARLAVVDALGAGPAALERRVRVVQVLVDVVDAGRAQSRGGERLTRFTAEGVVGAVLAVLHARLTEPRDHGSLGSSRGRSVELGSDGSLDSGGGRSVEPDDDRPLGPSHERSVETRQEALVGLLGPLMGLVVLPYRGRAAAEREVARPVPRRKPAGRPVGNPLRDLDMRLTYRTVRVLVTIAAGPGLNNREIADAAGVADQGQMSKLLARLEHLGLIANTSAGHTRGEPNAWQLTGQGREVHRTIATQATAGAA